MSFRCRKKYRLELHWDSIEYHSDRVARLQGACFKGPVLKNAAQIDAPDHISLDLTPQLINLISSYYIVRLDWDGVLYKEDKVLLEGATLSNDGLKEFHKLENEDFIVINTEKHEEATHAYHLVYESHVVRKDGKPYEYEGDNG